MAWEDIYRIDKMQRHNFTAQDKLAEPDCVKRGSTACLRNEFYVSGKDGSLAGCSFMLTQTLIYYLCSLKGASYLSFKKKINMSVWFLGS